MKQNVMVVGVKMGEIFEKKTHQKPNFKKTHKKCP